MGFRVQCREQSPVYVFGEGCGVAVLDPRAKVLGLGTQKGEEGLFPEQRLSNLVLLRPGPAAPLHPP
jgi:hypothetical protein